jgi:pyridoxal phosphate enzyme (YggS family)
MVEPARANLADAIRGNLEKIRADIASAAIRSGREPGDILLMGVTKFQPLDAVYAAFDCGLSLFGENRVQEREEKSVRWERGDAVWHMIGHLQRNKARRAIELFDCVESVDSADLAIAMEKIIMEKISSGTFDKASYPVFVEVNVSEENSKYGVPKEKGFALIEEIAVKCPHIEIQGLMTIGPNVRDEKIIRESFAWLRDFKREASARFGLPLARLSMGMSGDYRIAIEEGSDIVRIGAAIFGAREPIDG